LSPGRKGTNSEEMGPLGKSKKKENENLSQKNPRKGRGKKKIVVESLFSREGERKGVIKKTSGRERSGGGGIAFYWLSARRETNDNGRKISIERGEKIREAPDNLCSG